MLSFYRYFFWLGLCLSTWLRADWSVVPEAQDEGYQEIYRITIPVEAAWGTQPAIPYAVDHSAGAPAFDRSAYFMELTKLDGSVQWAWVSMAEADGKTAAELGLPHPTSLPIVRRERMTHMNVASNVPGIETGSFLEGGNVEMWSAASQSYDADYFIPIADMFGRLVMDWRDKPDPASGLYGVFQLHNHRAGQTIMAWNGWAAQGTADDLGIGNATLTNTDWTGTSNAGQYANATLSILVRPKRFAVTLSDFPRQMGIIPRQLPENTGPVKAIGVESSGGWESVVMTVQREGQAWGSPLVQPLVYQSGVASFNLSTNIPAEKASYTVDLWLRKAGSPDRLVRRAENICSGEVILVYGQSNANGGPKEGSATYLLTPWIRTFGGGMSEAETLGTDYWMKPVADNWSFYISAIGQWATMIASELSQSLNVPIAVINGARPGTWIPGMLKDRANPTFLHDDATTLRPYNRMLWRAKRIKAENFIRAIFYYQGEADSSGSFHSYYFNFLREDLMGDYPALGRIFAVQIGPNDLMPPVVSVPDAQRLLGRTYSNVTMATANGSMMPDGVHLSFNRGFKQIGQAIAAQAFRDVWGGPSLPDQNPPNAEKVEMDPTEPSGTRIKVTWYESVAGLTFEYGWQNDFYLAGTTAKVISGSHHGTHLLLTLDRPPVGATQLIYKGHRGFTSWLRNSRGIPPMTFSLPLSPPVLPEVALFSPTATTPTGLVTEPFTLSAQGSDAASGLTQLRLLVEGVEVARQDFASLTTPQILTHPWITPTAGEYTATVTARNALGWEKTVAQRFSIRDLAAPREFKAGIASWYAGQSLGENASPSQWLDLSNRHHTLTANQTGSGERGLIGLHPALCVTGSAPTLVRTESWPADSWTLAFLAQAKSPATAGSLLGSVANDTSGHRWAIKAKADGRWAVTWDEVEMIATAQLVPMTPHVVILQRESLTNQLSLWIDGILVGDAALSSGATATSLAIGGQGWSGCVSEMVIWSRVLSETERNQLTPWMNALSGHTQPSFSEWSSALLVSPAAQLATADPDHDGWPNLAEYVFGTRPDLFQSHAGQPITTTTDGSTLSLSVRRLASRLSVPLRVQKTDGLATWQTEALVAGPLDGEYQVWTWQTPMTADRQFVRLLLGE